MSNVSNGQVYPPNTRDNVDSYPLRTTINVLKNAINDNNTRINNALTAGPSEVTDARDNESSLQENIRLRAREGDRVLGANDFQVSEFSGGANDTISVATGTGIVNGIGVKKTAASTSAAISASSASNHKRVVVVIESDNTISALEGTEVSTASTAPFPAISAAQMPLGMFIIDSTSPVVISDADITDLRAPALNIYQGIQYWGASTTYSGDNVSTIVYTTQKGAEITVSFTYDGSDNLSTISWDDGTYVVENTITYDGSDNVDSQDLTLTV